MARYSFPVVGTSLHEQADTYGAGRSGGRSHKGIDIFAREGAPVVAVTSGTVVKSGNSGGLGGIRAWVRDDDGNYHYYAHLSGVNVRAGQRVSAGQRIGAVGNTGTEARNTPHHLHYSVNPSQHTSERGSFNPFEYLRANGAITARGGQREMGGGRTEGTGPTSPQATAGSNVHAPHSTAGLPDAPNDPNQEFLESRRTSSSTMASIMSAISSAASESGGKELNVSALFGDMFGSDNEPEEDVEVPNGY